MNFADSIFCEVYVCRYVVNLVNFHAYALCWIFGVFVNVIMEGQTRTDYEDIESPVSGLLTIDLDAPLTAPTACQTSTDDGHNSTVSETEVCTTAVDSDVLSDSTNSAYPSGNQSSPLFKVRYDECSNLLADEAAESDASIGTAHRWYQMPEASDFMSDAIHAAWNLATPANCSRDDVDSRLMTVGVPEPSVSYGAIDRWYQMPDSHGSSEENSQLVDNVMGLENDFLPRHSTPSRHADAWNFFRASPQFIYPLHTTSLPVPSHQTLAAPSQSVGKMVSGRSERTTLDEVSPRLEKPPYTYNAMMVMAIHQSKEKQLTFSQIQESLVKMFPFFGGPYKGWKRSLRKALHSSKCCIMSNDKMAWSIDYDNVSYAMFEKRSKQDNDKYMRFLHEQLNVAPVVPERKFRGEPLSLPSRMCFQPQDEDDFLGARKDCVQTPSLPSIGTFVEAGSSGQNRKRTWSKTEDSTQMSVKRTCAEEPTVNNVTDTSPPSLKADKVTNDPSWLSTGSFGISHHGFGQHMIGCGTTYDMTPINTRPYRNYTSFYPSQTPMNVGYWSAGSFSDLARQQMYWQQHMQHQLAHYTSPYWPTYGHAQSDVFSTEALNLTKPGTKGSE